MEEQHVKSREVVIERRESPNGSGYRATIFVNERARQGPDLSLDGLEVTNYMRNPVVLWAHDMKGQTESGGLPIGRTNRMTNDSGKLEVDFEFLEGDPFAERVRNAWDKGFLNAASVSWLPLESEETETGNQRDIRSDLLEWSIVSVPSDPDAVRNAHSRLMNTLVREGEIAEEKEEKEEVLEPEVIERQDDEATSAPCWQGEGSCSLRGIVDEAIRLVAEPEVELPDEAIVDDEVAEEEERIQAQIVELLVRAQTIKLNLRGDK